MAEWKEIMQLQGRDSNRRLPESLRARVVKLV